MLVGDNTWVETDKWYNLTWVGPTTWSPTIAMLVSAQ